MVVFTPFMNFVEPIRERKKISQIKNLLRGGKRFRDLLLFTGGINTALGISDLLRLRVEHFFDKQKRLRRDAQRAGVGCREIVETHMKISQLIICKSRSIT